MRERLARIWFFLLDIELETVLEDSNQYMCQKENFSHTKSPFAQNMQIYTRV